MPRKFLPRPADGASNPVSPSPGAFYKAEANLLSQVGVNMQVAQAQTEGRVPSPFSRAYMFYTALFGRSLQMTGNAAMPAVGPNGQAEDAVASDSGRQALQRQARATFRGLCALFALREALGIEITAEEIRLIPGQDRFASLLVPTMHSAPGGTGAWQPTTIFTVASGEMTPEVLAGRSVLTGVFPAASPPKTALAGVYWYEPPTEADETGKFRDADGRDMQPTATWHDPTADDAAGRVPLSSRTRTAVRGALARWLAQVLAEWTDEKLSTTGLSPRSRALLRGEFQAWANDLAADTAPATHVRVEPLDRTATHLPPFLNLVCRGVGDVVRSDLPLYHGRLFVNSAALASPHQRLWGRLYGQPSFGNADLPAQGDNLGRALGLGDRAAPIGFVFVDRLFTPRFTVIASGTQALSPEWRALAVDNGGQTEYALYPFRKEVLEVFSPAELRQAVSARFAQNDHAYLVSLDLDGQRIARKYTAHGEDGFLIDDEGLVGVMDIRLFPSVDLHAPAVASRNLLPRLSDGSTPDGTYYLRVRRAPTWSFDIRPFHITGGVADPAVEGTSDGAPTDGVAGDGATGAPPTTATPPRRTVANAGTDKRDRRRRETDTGSGDVAPGPMDVFTLSRAPDGIWIGDRGMCFVELPPPPQAGGEPPEWEIAVDFGTSNTCVAYRQIGTDKRPAPLDFPVLTTTLYARPAYGELRGTNEGASAALDFFYRHTGEEQFLLGPGPREAQPAYFPTQIATTQQALPQDGATPFSVDHGLILFRNLNLSGLELIRLVEGFATEQFDATGDQIAVRPLEKRFRLEQDIKWTRREWLRAFMAHLRLQIVLTAVYHNARVSRITFSYPKAFGGDQRSRFRTVLTGVWGQQLQPLISESEAVRSLLGSQATQNIVLDIGGGTTDLIGFSHEKPAFQTSFKLAAGAVTRYVITSKHVRELILGAVEQSGLDSPGGSGGMNLAGTRRLLLEGSDLQVQNAWTGLLQTIETADATGSRFEDLLGLILPEGADETDRRAVQGLLMTTALMFGSAAFLAGRLTRAASDGRVGEPFALASISIRLTGNGSKLYRLLAPEHGAFDRIMAGLFQAGLGDDRAHVPVDFRGIFQTDDGRVAPKTTVALGMLTKGSADTAAVPVANLTGETLGNAQPDTDLGSFYRQTSSDRMFALPDEAPPELSAFLDAFGRLMPRGYVGDVRIVPGLKTGWHEEMKTALYRDARATLLNRLQANARDVANDDASEEGVAGTTAYEPVLIAEVAALIDRIRETYA